MSMQGIMRDSFKECSALLNFIQITGKCGILNSLFHLCHTVSESGKKDDNNSD